MEKDSAANSKYHKITTYGVYLTLLLNVALSITSLINYFEKSSEEIELNDKTVLIISITTLIFSILVGSLMIYTTIKKNSKMHFWMSYLVYVSLPLNVALSIPCIYDYAKTDKIDRDTNDKWLIWISSISLIISTFTFGFGIYLHINS